MKLIIECTEQTYSECKKISGLSVTAYVIAHGVPYNPSGDAISRSALKETLKENEWITDDPFADGGVLEEIIDNAEAVFDDKAYSQGYKQAVCDERNARPQGEWGKWVITEVQCPECLGWFNTDCYSTEELNKCPSCGATMRGGAE